MQLSHARVSDIVIITVTGRVDYNNADAFRSALEPHLAQCSGDKDKLVLDMSNLEYISSAGLRIMMLAAKQAKVQGGLIVVASLGSVVKEIFDISRFNMVFEVFGTVREGIAKLSPASLDDYDRANS